MVAARHPWIDIVASIVALAAAAAAFATFVGWMADVPALAQWGTQAIAMQANTALAMIATGVAITLLGRRDAIALWLGAFAGAVGAATLIEHLSGVSLGIDQALVARDWGNAATSAPGRMGPPSALCFTLLGAGIVFAARGRGDRARSTAWALALMTLCVACVPLLGYVYGAARLYSRPQLTGIALQTAISFVACSIAMLARVRDRRALRLLGADSGAGMLARRVLPAIVIVPIVLGWARMRAQDAGWFGAEIGATLYVIAVIIWCALVLWWGVEAVDARERVLAALNERQRLADMALANSRDQITVVDSQWRYAYVNERVLELNDARREDMLGATMWSRYPQMLGTEFEALARRAMAQRTRESLDYLHPLRQRWYEVRIEPTPDGGLAFVALDVTERRELEAELELAGRRKDEFLATLAHELRNPLAPIRTSLEIIKRAQGDAALVERARATAERQMALVVRLIDDLLDVSRITRNKLALRLAPTTLQAAIEDAVETTKPQFHAAQATLHVSVPPEPVSLEADRVRLAQVFANLLGNACKYGDAGNEVWLDARVAGSEAIVAVRDRGIGIHPAMLEHIFGMFSQVDASLERSRGGLGIGLTLVRQLVQLHGGRVTAHSEGEGEGSTFTVHLPLVPVAQPVGAGTTAPVA